MADHPNIVNSTIFTCHTCHRENEQRAIEWPPLIFACGNKECGSVFKFEKENPNGTVKMKLIYRTVQ